MELVSRHPSGFQNFEVSPFYSVLSNGYGTWLTYDVGDLYVGFCWGILKGPPGKPGPRWEDNIRMDLTEIGWGREWIDLTRNRTSRLIFCMLADRHQEANSPFSEICERAYKLSCVIMTCLISVFIKRVGTLIVASIYLQLIQSRYTFRSFTVLQCSHQHCVQPVASDVEVVGYL